MRYSLFGPISNCSEYRTDDDELWVNVMCDIGVVYPTRSDYPVAMEIIAMEANGFV